MKKQYRHFSHSHALQPYDVFQDDEETIITCSGCEQQLPANEPAYFCPKPDCDFYLDKSCFELPKTLEHISHKDHKLTLSSEPPSHRIYYNCDACGDLINAFSFHCEKCDFKMHSKCALFPDTVDCKAHDQHELGMCHYIPKSSKDWFASVMCDVCDEYVAEGYWSYFCKDCDFVTHLGCAFADVVAPVEEEEEVDEVEDKEEVANEEEVHDDRHYSHSHALQPYDVVQDDEETIITCSGCEQQLPANEPTNFCPKPDCHFYLDKSCFELPKTLEHISHKDHKLTLLPEPPSHRIYYNCDACGDLINAFSFHCEKCDFKIHSKCALFPDTVDCKAHDQHELGMRHYIPKSSKDWFASVMCDVCDEYVAEGYWSYFCKDCDFVTHLGCAFADVVAPVEEEEEVDEVEDKEEVANEEEEVNDDRHYSHSHALQPYDVVQDDEEIIITCSGCEQQLPANEPTYFCPKPDCDFYLDKSCFELPKTLEHISHKDHKLTLLLEPPIHRIYYDCNACGDLINAFSFHCEKSCDFKIHPKCALLPDTVDCKAHDQHELAMRHCTPESESTISCDVCEGYVTEGYWSYFCKNCDFVTHLECAFADVVAPVEEEEVDEVEDEEEVNEEDGELSDAMRLHLANIRAMDRMARLQFQMKMAEMNARAVATMFRTTYN